MRIPSTPCRIRPATRNMVQCLLVALAFALAPLVARSEDWPSRPLRWIVAYPAGGGSDFLARQLAPQLGKQLGQPIVIDNRPGAAGIIGTELAARSPADGYTLLTGDNGAMVFHPAMMKKLPYDPRELAPVGFMARFPLILAVHPRAGFDSAAQFIATVKSRPGRYSYASPGVGSPHHLAMELLIERAGLAMVHVPYRGTSPAVQDVIGGQVPVMVLDTAAGLPQIRSGALKALAVLSRQRIAALPEVPTLGEIGRDTGLSDFEVTAWQALFVPRGTPGAIVARLSAEMLAALSLPEVRARLEDYGLQVTPTDGPALAAFIARETAFWQLLIRERKLSVE